MRSTTRHSSDGPTRKVRRHGSSFPAAALARLAVLAALLGLGFAYLISLAE